MNDDDDDGNEDDNDDHLRSNGTRRGDRDATPDFSFLVGFLGGKFRVKVEVDNKAVLKSELTVSRRDALVG